MIGPGAGARVMVATRPVDFRKGPDALSALVSAEYGGDPYSGVIYVFRAKRADRIKLIYWDGTGWAILASLIETAKLSDIDPQAYIASVITRIVAGHPQNKLDDLLPWAYAPEPLKAVA